MASIQERFLIMMSGIRYMYNVLPNFTNSTPVVTLEIDKGPLAQGWHL